MVIYDTQLCSIVSLIYPKVANAAAQALNYSVITCIYICLLRLVAKHQLRSAEIVLMYFVEQT